MGSHDTRTDDTVLRSTSMSLRQSLVRESRKPELYPFRVMSENKIKKKYNDLV